MLNNETCHCLSVVVITKHQAQQKVFVIIIYQCLPQTSFPSKLTSDSSQPLKHSFCNSWVGEKEVGICGADSRQLSFYCNFRWFNLIWHNVGAKVCWLHRKLVWSSNIESNIKGKLFKRDLRSYLAQFRGMNCHISINFKSFLNLTFGTFLEAYSNFWTEKYCLHRKEGVKGWIIYKGLTFKIYLFLVSRCPMGVLYCARVCSIPVGAGWYHR